MTVLRAGLLLLVVALLAACGHRDQDGPSSPGRWSVVRLDGITEPTGVAVAGEHLLLVAAGNDRNLYVVPRASLRDGTSATARAIEIRVDPQAHLGGSDPFAARGYLIGDLWAHPVEFQGLAVLGDQVHVVDRTYRVVYRGTLGRDVGGAPSALFLDGAYVVPGAQRSGAERADYRDVGPGLAGATAAGSSGTDVNVVERAAPDGVSFRVWRMDRSGQALEWFSGTTKGAPSVADIARSGDRFLVLRARGDGPAAIAALRPGGMNQRIETGDPVPGPATPGAGAWRGITEAPDGTLLVVSGAPAHLAWRAP